MPPYSAVAILGILLAVAFFLTLLEIIRLRRNYEDEPGRDIGSHSASRLPTVAVQSESSAVIFDLETTGLNPLRDRIVEIGAIKVRADTVVDQFHHLVNPECPIPFIASSVHRITDKMVQREGTIEQILPNFLEFIGQNVLVAHNAQFDMGFLNTSYGKYDIAEAPTMDLRTVSSHEFRFIVMLKLTVPVLGSIQLWSQWAWFCGVPNLTLILWGADLCGVFTGYACRGQTNEAHK